MLEDVTSVAVHTALSGLSMRQRAIADNVANIQTPGFLSGRVSFEDALRAAVADGHPGAAKATIARSLEPTREDGNNVNLDEETLSNTDTSLRYSLMLRAMDDKFALLSRVIKGTGA